MQIEVPIADLRKKKIFVATPMYAGMCSGMYTKACCDLATTATKYQIDLKYFYLFNESLITRARNYCVDEFLRSDYTHLMFIDSDICFDPNYVLTLAALCDDTKPIVGGIYPKKCIAWEKVRNAVDKGLGDDNPMLLEKFTGDFVFNPVGGTSTISLSEPVEALEIGTGFMMVQREVFEKFAKAYPKFRYKPDHNRSDHFDGSRYIHAFFDTIIDNDQWMGKGKSEGSDRYLSEDYMFCQLCHKIDIKTYLCPWMKLQHIGTYVFNGNLPDMGALEFAAHGYDTESRPFLEDRKTKLASKGMSRKDRRALAKEKRKESKKKDKSSHAESPNHL
tara:strand:+ start:278 stop:1276 length:999 start_codon:yes stop_codon:yes gene_type:complete